MTTMKIKSVRVGFGVTLMPKSQGDNVYKYHFEPEIEFEVPGECDETELQAYLDKMADDLISKVQQSVRKKVQADKHSSNMSRQGDKYEKTVAFVVNVFLEAGENYEQFHLQEKMELPISKKIYRVTAKNVDVYIDELMKSRPEIKSVRLDRISHVKIYEKSI
jgi:hypothetical protein